MNGGRKTPIAKFIVCSRHEQLSHVVGIRPQWETTIVREKATVVSKVHVSRSNERLMYNPHDHEHDSLTDWQQ